MFSLAVKLSCVFIRISYPQTVYEFINILLIDLTHAASAL